MSTDYSYIKIPQETFDKLLTALQTAAQALQNVPIVGHKYDQQHSDTHLRAELLVREVVAEAEKQS